MSKDPVKNCNLYKQEGCAHVDGMFCDFETCSMRIDYDKHGKAIEPEYSLEEAFESYLENL